MRQIIPSLSHAPTWFFIIGYPLFWLELYVFKAPWGVTTPIAWTLVIAVFLAAFLFWAKESKSGLKEAWKALSPFERLIYAGGIFLSFLSMIIITLAGSLPIHLIQEFDCMQYHYTLPRQHLILGSMAHIPWAADDLFLLPLDFALAPFWFATLLPNKLPQLIVSLALVGLLARMVFELRGKDGFVAALALVFGFFGSHGFGIQMGTGMLDLVIAYLLFAAIDSFRKGQWQLGMIELAFFVWSKPLMPIQVIVAVAIIGALWFMAERLKWQFQSEIILKVPAQAWAFFGALSIVIAGPFIYKSLVYAATPFYPLAPGMLGDWGKIQANPQAWDSLQRASHLWMVTVKDMYGHGRGILEFIQHWWLLAVAEAGVRNTFDYPMGLSYLLFLGPFFYYAVKDFGARKIGFWTMAVLLVWGCWWFGSQQGRFLYIPILLMMFLTLIRLPKISRVLVICLVLAIGMQIISLLGAHRYDLINPSLRILRPEDQELIQMSGIYIKDKFQGSIALPNHDAAYAQFPVTVRKENLPHTILF